MAEPPSGAIGASHELSAARILSAGKRESAAPPPPSPRITESVGESNVAIRTMVSEMWKEMPPSSADLLNCAPGVSITVTSGNLSSRATWMARCAVRSPSGDTTAPDGLFRRSCPRKTAETPQILPTAAINPLELRSDRLPSRKVSSDPQATRTSQLSGRSESRDHCTDLHGSTGCRLPGSGIASADR